MGLYSDPAKATLSMHNLLPEDGAASIYWPFQISGNLGVLYSTPQLLISASGWAWANQKTYTVNPYVYLPAGTHAFMWTIWDYDTDPYARIRLVIDGGTVLRLKRLYVEDGGRAPDSLYTFVASGIVLAEGWHEIQPFIDSGGAANMAGSSSYALYHSYGVTTRLTRDYAGIEFEDA